MFLKIRNEEEGAWWYIAGFDRLKVGDPESLTSKDSRYEEIFKEANLRTMNRSADREQDPENFQVINAIWDNGDRSQKEYVVVFDTAVYLCDDSGKTVEAFRPNG